jgi:hypothetical protein
MEDSSLCSRGKNQSPQTDSQHVASSQAVISVVPNSQVGPLVARFIVGCAMKANRVWIETVTLGTTIACACALLIATFAAGTAALTRSADAEIAQTAGTTQTNEATSEPLRIFEGMVTCSRCGAKHSAALGKAASDCTRQCVHAGASFALVEDERTYVLSGDLAALKKVAGQRATLRGTLRGNTIQVASVAPD